MIDRSFMFIKGPYDYSFALPMPLSPTQLATHCSSIDSFQTPIPPGSIVVIHPIPIGINLHDNNQKKQLGGIECDS